MAGDQDSPTILQLEEPIEGDRIETDDYFFSKLGDSIPLTSSNAPVFDTETLPSKPLALSPRLGLIFVAHSSGFVVARTKDVIDAAKEIKEKGSARCVPELSVVDVDVGRVCILALSDDSSYLAAVTGIDIHFFAVDSLLNQDKKPMYSCSVESNHVKDMFWIKDTKPSYVVLTDRGSLHLGSLHKPQTNVMDHIDAVERSVDGNVLAIAQKNSLRILSAQLKEISRISLPFDSFTGDDGGINSVKVDSIRWVRADSIVVGCLQESEDDREEGYSLQVIVGEEGSILNDNSRASVVQFSDVFPGIVGDIVPFGGGPHLIMTYVENCELAIVSNRKNTDEHIMLLSWSQKDNQVAVVDIVRDTWLPRIELQENDDDNLVLGVCIDKASILENVKVFVEKEKVLQPHCLLVYLTLEGKLVLFSVASDAGSPCSNEASLETNIQSSPLLSGSRFGEALSQSEERVKESGSDSGSDELKKSSTAPDIIPIAKDATTQKNVNMATKVDENLNKEPVDVETVQKEPVAVETAQKGLADVSTFKPFGYAEGFPQASSIQFKVNEPPAQAFGGSEMWKIAPQGKSLENMADANKGLEKNIGSGVPHIISTPTGSSSFAGISSVSTVRPLLSSPGSTKSTLSGSPFTSTDTAYSSGGSLGKSGSLPSDAYSSSIGKAVTYSQKPTINDVTEASPDIPMLTLHSRLSVSSQNPTTHSMQLMKGNNPNFTSFGQLNSEENLPKQFGNVQNMAKELDKLLECIEGSGGFRDICTTAQRRSVEALEEGMQSLSERSSVWQSATEERLRDIEHLLDKTVQVFARKTHIEGIVRQTTDEHYWDLWNRQKLSSELDQKRQTVLNLSQDLVNCMIELEKHFNTLELNNFGESGGANLDPRTLHNRSAKSRHSQSLRTVHNAAVSQLAAAQQLSSLLSRQMSVLKIMSPTKQANIKKQVFETIGLPYPDDNLGSPNMAEVFDSPSNKHFSGSAATHNEIKRGHLSGRSSDLECSRRRRDSLDRNWTKFEAPKTTVKRMLVQNEQRSGSWTPKGFLMDKQFVGPCNLEGSIAGHPKALGVEDKNGGKNNPTVNPVPLATSTFKWAGAIPETAKLQAEQISRPSPPVHGNRFSAVDSIFSSSSPLPSLPSISSFMAPNSKKENSSSTVDRPGSKIGDFGRSDSALTDLKSTMPKIQPQQPPPLVQSSQLSKHSKETGFLKPNGSSLAAVSFSKPNVNYTSTLESLGASSAFAASVATLGAQTLSIAHTEPPLTTAGKVVKDASKESVQVPSSACSASSSAASHVDSFSSKGPLRLNLNSMGSASSSAASLVDSFSLKGPRVDLSLMGSSVNSAKVSPKIISSLAETLTEKASAETKLATSSTVSQKLASSAEDRLNSESLTPSAASAAVSDALGSAPNFSNAASVSSGVVTNISSEKQSTTLTLPPFSLSNTASTDSGKNHSDAAVVQEDEMEEEAPESNSASDLSLGSLSGFGLGTAVSATVPISNPFGGSISSTTPSTTSFSLTVPSGQLFRPASFSFQSPQASQQSQSPGFGVTSGTFGSTTVTQQQPPAASGFGQPGQVGFGGQQALGSVLGSFGQSRQIGAGFPGTGFGGSPSSGGFRNTSPVGGSAGASANTGGFAGTGGGFAGIAPSSGGFAGIGATASGFAAAVAAPGGGFTAAAPSVGGFAAAAPSGGGFGAAANSGGFGGGFAAAGNAGAGFGAFNNQGTGGFSGFGGGNTGARPPPSELFTQMRR